MKKKIKLEDSSGDIELKKRIRKKINYNQFKEFESENKLWIPIHENYYTILADETTLHKAVEKLVEICVLLVKGYEEKSIDFKHLNMAEGVFDTMTAIYTEGGELYDIYNGELQPLTELISLEDDINRTKTELVSFLEKYYPEYLESVGEEEAPK